MKVAAQVVGLLALAAAMMDSIVHGAYGALAVIVVCIVKFGFSHEVPKPH